VNSGRVEKEMPSLYDVIFGADYAPDLEWGTPHMAARPFLRPAVEAERQKFVADLRRIVERH